MTSRETLVRDMQRARERTLRLVPALDGYILEADRDRDLLAPPWLSWQRMLQASDAAMAEYPETELAAVRESFAELKTVYLDRDNPTRPVRFAKAMDRFAVHAGDIPARIPSDFRRTRDYPA